MKWKNTEPREYYSKYQKVNVTHDQGWFDVYRLPGDVYGICEPQHFQEVNAFLIIGSKKALLLDTGMGIADIKPLVKELYGGEIQVVNSHFHFDHVGANWQFEPIYIFDDPYAIAAAAKERTAEELGDQLDEDMFLFDYPIGFSPEDFHIKPYKTIPMHEGYQFDLGNRVLTVYHTPGHCNDAIMLYDEREHILFTGDSFYLGALYAHFHCQQFGHGNLQDYYASMNKMCCLSDVKALYASHNDFIVDPVKLREAADALKSIIEGKALAKDGLDRGHTYLEGGRMLTQYPFDGFSIVCD